MNEQYIFFKLTKPIHGFRFAGLPISKVEFPSVVICSQGFDIDAISAAMNFYLFKELNNSSQEMFNKTPIGLARIQRRNQIMVAQTKLSYLIMVNVKTKLSYLIMVNFKTKLFYLIMVNVKTKLSYLIMSNIQTKLSFLIIITV
jgi:hypothetical protein